MKNFMTTAAVSLTLIGGATAALADGHAVDPEMVTCEDYAAMDLTAREALRVELLSIIDMEGRDDFSVNDIDVVCNGADSAMVKELLDNDA